MECPISTCRTRAIGRTGTAAEGYASVGRAHGFQFHFQTLAEMQTADFQLCWKSAKWLKNGLVDGAVKMYYEKLALEVGATVAGLDVVKPAVISGESGTDQRFTFVAADGSDMYAFDIYTDVREIDILRTYVKKMDTGAKAFVVCLSGRPDAKAKELARNYGIDVLSPMEVGDFFSNRITQFIRSPKTVRAGI